MANARQKILCIEDDDETAALIAEELIERGFEVVVAHSGWEGLQALMRSPTDLVLCDIGMPVMTGFEVLQSLKELGPRFGKIPLIFLTALTGRDDELKGRRLGPMTMSPSPSISIGLWPSSSPGLPASRAHSLRRRAPCSTNVKSRF